MTSASEHWCATTEPTHPQENTPNFCFLLAENYGNNNLLNIKMYTKHKIAKFLSTVGGILKIIKKIFEINSILAFLVLPLLNRLHELNSILFIGVLQ